jgi:hypothetical protein
MCRIAQQRHASGYDPANSFGKRDTNIEEDGQSQVLPAYFMVIMFNFIHGFICKAL